MVYRILLSCLYLGLGINGNNKSQTNRAQVDGSVVTWGHPGTGGDSAHVQAELARLVADFLWFDRSWNWFT